MLTEFIYNESEESWYIFKPFQQWYVTTTLLRYHLLLQT